MSTYEAVRADPVAATTAVVPSPGAGPVARTTVSCPVAGLAHPPPRVQRSPLHVGSVDDADEVEAERTAGLVVTILRRHRSAPTTTHSGPATGSQPRDPRGDGEPRSSLAALRRAFAAQGHAPEVGAEGGALTPETAGAISRLAGHGRPLSSDVRRSMEDAFGADLSDVRIHDGPAATDVNERVQARAFTVGSDVVFRSAAPGSSSEAGQHLLAHELAHVLQNKGVRPLDSVRRHVDTHAPATAQRPPVPRAPVRRRSTLRRLVGFEVELSVPTLRNTAGLAGGTKFGGGAWNPMIGQFFTGGVPYGAQLGQVPSPAGPIDMTADHNVIQHRGRDLYNAIRALGGWLLPANGYVSLSNLEFATQPLDELAAGSNATFQALATAIDTHTQAILALNPATRSQPLPLGGAHMVGFPEDLLQTWLPYATNPGVQAAAQALSAVIRWDMYVQATVGVLPSSLDAMYQSQALSLPGGPAGGKEAALLDAAQAVAAASAAVTAQPFFTGAANALNIGDQEGLRGAVAIAISYAVGNALGQTNILTGTQKNAVQLLYKGQLLGDVANVATTPGVQALRGDPAMLPFITNAAAWIHATVPQAGYAHWQAAPYNSPALPPRPPILGTVGMAPLAATTSLLTDLLTGTNTASVIRSGGALPGPDAPSPTVAGAVGGQSGVPLELRWIRTRPAGAGQLWPVMQSVLAQVRAANLQHVNGPQRAAVLAAL